jgi:hypothetical protein
MALSEQETKLSRYLDSLYVEGAASRAVASKNWENAIKVIKGETWPSKRPKYKISAVMNFLGQIVERKAALLTDSRPTISVTSRKAKDDPICDLLQKTIGGILEEKNFEQKITEFVMLEEYFGFALFNTCFDQNLDYGKGDIDLVVIDPRCFIFDPFVTRSWNLQHGEYCCLETVRPTELLCETYKERRDDIKADISTGTTKPDSLVHKLRQLFQFDKDSPNQKTSVIPRSIVRDWWVRDRTTKKGEGLAFPNWRHILIAGGVPVADGVNPYLDGNLPFDGMEWGFNVDSAYGTNEIDQLENPQVMFNKVLASILENAILMSNGIWIGDRDALTEEGWRKLSNEPGSHVRVRPGKQLRRDAPPSLPTYIMSAAEMMINGLEKLSGITEVTEGRRPGQVCVDPQTECLTKRGWKKYNELLEKDEIYCFDQRTEVGMWSPLIGLAIYDWDDEMYSVKTDRMDCLVTPNHGWCVGNTSVPGYVRVEMKDIHTGHFIPNKVRLVDDAVLPKLHDAFVELVGWIVTEGCFNIGIRKENGKLRYRVIISQSRKSNEDNCKRIYRCLKQAPFNFSMYEDKRGSGVIDFTIHGEPARLLMEWLPEKKLTYNLINLLSVSQLELLYDTMLRGDGSRFDPTNVKSQDIYFSSDVELSNQFQMIATLLGKATNQREGKADLRVESHKKSYYGIINKVSCRREDQNKWRTLLKHREIQHYQGKVWCPQTLTGTWIARRNGITYLTGNTSGVAIESLAIMAQTTIRLKARQIESLIQRIGQKLIPRIFAYYTENRIFNLVGEKGGFQQYIFDREVIRQAVKADSRGLGIFQDYQFRVVPASSLAMTKWQKGLIATQLFQMGAIDQEALLEAIEFQQREEIMERMESKSQMIPMEAIVAALQGDPNSQNVMQRIAQVMQKLQGKGKQGGGKGAPAKLPSNLLRGVHRETGLQEPQIGK